MGGLASAERRTGDFTNPIEDYRNCQNITGGLAHLARASDWQSGGNRFKSDILHKRPTNMLVFFNFKQEVIGSPR